MFQYNLRTLMLVMVGVCVLTWLFFVLPGEIGVVVLWSGLFLAPSAVVSGILYFRGYGQAFAIGCIPPLVMLGWFAMMEGDDLWRRGPGDDLEDKVAIVVLMLVIMAGGGVAAGVRWLAVWSRQPQIESKTFPGLSRPSTAGNGGARVSKRHILPPDS
jgi:hypothetical protein